MPPIMNTPCGNFPLSSQALFRALCTIQECMENVLGIALGNPIPWSLCETVTMRRCILVLFVWSLTHIHIEKDHWIQACIDVYGLVDCQICGSGLSLWSRHPVFSTFLNTHKYLNKAIESVNVASLCLYQLIQVALELIEGCQTASECIVWLFISFS